MRLRVGAHTSTGRRRSENQDFLLYRIASTEPDAGRDCSLFLAADGVGGAAGGATASELAARTFAQRFPRRWDDDPTGALVTAIQAAGRAVDVRAQQDRELTGMATTLVAAVVHENRVWMANVGDSRGYLVRGGSARQITEDHSLVAESVRAGRLTPAAAAINPYRHMITRSLGSTGDAVEVDIFGPFQLEPGDRLLLCTDGLTETMNDQEIAAILVDGDADAVARALVDAANERGGPDNISVIVVVVEP